MVAPDVSGRGVGGCAASAHLTLLPPARTFFTILRRSGVVSLRDRVLEVLTDERLEPHLYLAGLLLLTALVGWVLWRLGL